MKKYICALALAVMSLSMGAQVKPGVEVLRDGGFAQLKGTRVGVLTNPTGVGIMDCSTLTTGAIFAIFTRSV